jgi:hypothetical protein
MGRRFAIVIGVAAAGVMALGAQTAAADVVKYDTKVTIHKHNRAWYHGFVYSDRDHNLEYDPATAVRKCMGERRVILFKQRPGADRKLGTDESEFFRAEVRGSWSLGLDPAAGSHGRLYVKVTRKVRDRFVCRADRSRTIRGSHDSTPALATAAPNVVKYDTELTLTKESGGGYYHGWVMSDRDRNPEYDPAKGVRKCMVGRRVVLFRLRPGADRKLGTDRSEWGPRGRLFRGRNAAPQFPQGLRQGRWEERVRRDYGDRVRAKVQRKVRDRYVCRADHAVYSH